jgi:hypothetical protein
MMTAVTLGLVALMPGAPRWLSSASITSLALFLVSEFFREHGAEVMHDGCPVVCVEDAPFAYVNVFKNHTNVGFFYGAYLDDPAGLLKGTGRNMRHVKLKPGREPNAVAIGNLIDAAYLDVKTRLRAE